MTVTGLRSALNTTMLLAVVMLLGVASAAAPKSPVSPEEVAVIEKDAYNYSKWCMVSLAGVGAAIFIYNFLHTMHSKARFLLCLGRESTPFWSTSNTDIFPNVQRKLLWAPLLAKRHNREMRISAAINMGTLPTRFEGLLLLAFVGLNVMFCVLDIDYSAPKAVVLLNIRKRTGIMAVVNMVPLFILAGRNNPFIKLLSISFDNYNLMHRWLGRIVVLESLAHTLAWMIGKISSSGWEGVSISIRGTQFLTMGFIATVGMCLLALHSPSIFRHAFYETFLAIHFLLVLLVLITTWIHLAHSDGPWLLYVKIAIFIWAADRFLRLVRIIYRNIGTRASRATVELLPGDAVKLTLTMPRPWTHKPGQHAYLYLPAVGLWTSHPFSVAWSEEKEIIKFDSEKLAMNRKDLAAKDKAQLSFIIRRRTGFTDTIWRKAAASPQKMFSTLAFAEGPYGVSHSFDSYATAILIAGGVGITHQIPYIQHLVRGYAAGTTITRRILVVWCLASTEHLLWIKDWMTSILAEEKRREVLKIMLFVTRPKNDREVHSPSETVQMFPGKPNIGTLIDMEIERKLGAVGVSVCGTGALSDDVRQVVNERKGRAAVHYVEEAFTW